MTRIVRGIRLEFLLRTTQIMYTEIDGTRSRFYWRVVLLDSYVIKEHFYYSIEWDESTTFFTFNPKRFLNEKKKKLNWEVNKFT